MQDIRNYLKRIYLAVKKTDEMDLYQSIPVLRNATSVDEILNQEAVFIVSPGRSGTKTFIEELQKSTDLFALHAPKPWMASIGYRRYFEKVSKESAFWSFYATREKYLQFAYDRKKIFVDGDCKNLPLLEDIAEFMPNAKFIHIVRNPKSFIKSGLKRGYFSEKSAELWGHLSRREHGSDKLNVMERAKCIAEFWQISNEIADRIKLNLPENRFVSIKAEDMFKDGCCISSALNKIHLGGSLKEELKGVLKVRNKNSNKGVGRLDDVDEESLDIIIEEVCPSYGFFYN